MCNYVNKKYIKVAWNEKKYKLKIRIIKKPICGVQSKLIINNHKF